MDIEVDAPEEFPEDEVAPEEVANEDFAPVKVSTKEVAPEVVKAQKSLNNTQHCLECNEHFESSRSYRFHMRIHNIKTEDFPVQIKIEPEAKLCIIDMKQEPKKFHTCDICQKSFVAVISLNAHKKFRHQIKPIVDKDDDDIKIVDKPLIRPLKTKRDKKNIQHECEVCDVVLFRRDYLLNHIKIVHPGEYMCTFCSRVSHNYVDLIHHIKTFHKERTFDDTNLHGCQKCYAKFSVKDHLNIHMMEKHVKKPTVSNLYCAPCKKTYPFTFILSRHRKHATHVELSKIEERLIHNFEERLKLNSKEKKYDTIIVKNIPQRRNSINNQGKYYLKYFVNKGSLFICDICKATFTIRKQLIQHLKTHTEIPTHDCPSCPLKFLIKHKYDLHLKTHTVDRKEKSKYSCKICLSLFSTRKNLMIHINVRHSPTDNPNFICGVCGNGHANENELITHFKTHTGDNLPQVFVKEETEENPIDIDKPFCEICQLPFKYKIIQNIHNNMWHNESNPDRHLTIEVQRLKKEEKNVIKFIKCKICEEVFIKPDDLDEHVKTLHSDHDKSDDDSKLIIDESSSDQSKTDFFCDKCNLKFPCQQYLTNHQTLFCKSSPKVIINVSENQNTLNEQ